MGIKILKSALMASDGDGDVWQPLLPHSLAFAFASGFRNKWAFLQLIPSHLGKNESIANCGLAGSEASWSAEPPPRGLLSALTGPRLRVCCLVQVTVFCQVLWLPATVFVAVCPLWAGRSLLVSSRSVHPAGKRARPIPLALEAALRQPAGSHEELLLPWRSRSCLLQKQREKNRKSLFYCICSVFNLWM